jgi:hypothetical protein
MLEAQKSLPLMTMASPMASPTASVAWLALEYVFCMHLSPVNLT